MCSMHKNRCKKSDSSANLTLYYIPESSPCRAVMLVGKYLGLNLNLKHVDMANGENRSEAFLKLNPQHTVPVLTDGDFVLTESRAIMIYLAEKYCKDDTFYPRDAKKKALINQKLFFDLGNLYTNVLRYFVIAYAGAKKFDESYYPNIEEAFKYLDMFLEENDYITGNNLTVADLGIVTSVATAISVFDFEVEKYGNVNRWLTNLKNMLPDYDEVIVKNGDRTRQRIHGLMAAN